MRLKDVLSFAAFAAIIVFVLGYFATLGIRVNPPDERTNLTLEVGDVNGLVAGSSVLLRGAVVGKVVSTSTAIQSATVHFYVDGGYDIPIDSEIRLENLSALGETYISLLPQSSNGPRFQNGQHIATEAVTQPPSVSELATSVTRVLDQLDPSALRRVISEVDTALPDPAEVLPNISRASQQLRNTVADFRGAGRTVLDNFQTLLENSQYVAPALNRASPVVRKIAVGLQDLLKGYAFLVHRGEPENIAYFNKFLRRVQNLLDTSGGDLKVLGEALLPKLNAISAALMNFDTSQILDNALAAVPPDGTINLRVVP